MNKSSAYARLVRARFLAETAYLGPEKQKHLARALQKAHQSKTSREAAQAAIEKARAK